MFSLDAHPKRYIHKGKKLLSKQNYHTQCSLMLNSQDGTAPSLLRASCDPYLNDTNFSDLPDMPLADKEEAASKTLFTNLTKLLEMQRTMKYNEEVQARIYSQQRTQKPFKNSLQYFNKNVNGRFGRNKNKVLLPVPDAILNLPN